MWSENSFKNAGISRSSYRLIDQLSCQFEADRFTVFSHRAFEPSSEWRGRKNLTVKSIVPFGRGKRALWEYFGAGREANSGNFDVWFSTTSAVPRRSKIPTAAVIHDMIPILYPQHGDPLQVLYLRTALLQVARRVDRVITNSEQTKSDVVRLAKVDPAKVVVVSFGPGSDFSAANLKKGNDAGWRPPFERFLLVLGTLEPRKNLPKLFEAMSLLGNSNHADLGLVVAGGRGWKEQGIFEMVEKLGLSQRIQFGGYVEDEKLSYLFNTCSGFIFPSVYEGFGMPIVEAMQRRAPVLTSGLGAMKEVAGDAAIFFDPHQASSIADAISNFLDLDPDARCDLVQRGERRASKYSWVNGARETRKVLLELVEGR